jgi:hypothetical protein
MTLGVVQITWRLNIVKKSHQGSMFVQFEDEVYFVCCKNMFLSTLYLCDNEAMETEWASFPILLVLKKHLRKKAGNGASKRTRKRLALFEIKFPLVAVVMTFYHSCSSPLFLVRFFSPFPFFISPPPLLQCGLGKKN